MALAKDPCMKQIEEPRGAFQPQKSRARGGCRLCQSLDKPPRWLLGGLLLCTRNAEFFTCRPPPPPQSRSKSQKYSSEKESGDNVGSLLVSQAQRGRMGCLRPQSLFLSGAFKQPLASMFLLYESTLFSGCPPTSGGVVLSCFCLDQAVSTQGECFTCPAHRSAPPPRFSLAYERNSDVQ